MARPWQETQVGTGSSAPFIADTYTPDFNVGFGCSTSGTVTYSVQHTYDSYDNIQASSAVWFDHSVVTEKTTNADGNYNNNSPQGPVTAIRVTVSSGSGAVTLRIVQSGPSR